MEFISGKDDSPKGCVFCVLPKENEDRRNLILHRGEHAFVILNKFPYNNGHLMIVPHSHSADYTQLPEPVLIDMNRLTQKALLALGAAYRPEGFNMGMNLGHAAGAGIREHLHLHIVPRWVGDTNFMPVVAEAKCMPQHLETSYDQLAEQFRRI
jgi:ATP adenylyltransferase